MGQFFPLRRGTKVGYRDSSPLFESPHLLKTLLIFCDGSWADFRHLDSAFEMLTCFVDPDILHEIFSIKLLQSKA